MQYQIETPDEMESDVEAGDNFGFATIDSVDRDDDHTTVVLTIEEPYASIFGNALDSLFVEQMSEVFKEAGLEPDGYSIKRIDEGADDDGDDIIDLGFDDDPD